MPSNNADVTASNLREVMSHYLTGVTIVTVTKPDGAPYGLTVNSFNTAGFAINIMAADQTDLCRSFAGKDSDRFDGVDWTFGKSGQPLITHALAHIECRPWQTYAGGDHTIFIGEVMHAHHLSDRPAAAFFKGQLGHYEC